MFTRSPCGPTWRILTLTVWLCVLVAAAARADTLSTCDDCSSAAVPLGFTAKFFDQTYDSVYVNNNGNVTFTAPLSAFTPFGLAGTSQVIIAPFFADVDTRGTGRVTYGATSGENCILGGNCFQVSWLDVGYFNSHTDKTNRFALQLNDASSQPGGQPGDFDIEFLYARITWETGDVSGGTNGFGGSSAHAGFSNGSSQAGTSFEFEGSGTPGAFLDSNDTTGLIHGSRDAPIQGGYAFHVRNGVIVGADLSLIMVVTPDLVGVGKDMTFTLRVDNHGPSTATSVKVIDTLPENVTFKSASAGCTSDAGAVTCLIGQLGPDAFVTRDTVVTRNDTAGVVNEAVVLGNEFDGNPENDVATATMGDVPSCFNDLLLRSSPKSLTFKAKPHAVMKKIKLAVINRGSAPIDISDIRLTSDPGFVIQRIKPHVPRRIPKRKSDLFTITVKREAELPEVTAPGPFFTISFTCEAPPH